MYVYDILKILGFLFFNSRVAFVYAMVYLIYVQITRIRGLPSFSRLFNFAYVQYNSKSTQLRSTCDNSNNIHK